MRIVAGSARSRTILTPEGRDTRPTLDRVRESLFNILQPYTMDAQVLDLFAGSGALSLEALSRGAKSAVMVDTSREANQILQKNTQTLGFTDRATVLHMDYKQALLKLAAEKKYFDLVFLDPPYAMTELDEIGRTLRKGEMVDQDSLIVIEHDVEASPVFDEAFTLTDRRRYGKAAIDFYRLLKEE